MNKEELIKNQFPNDEFLQSAVSQIVDKCTADLEQKLGIERSSRIALVNKIAELEKENEELKGQAEMSYEVYNDNLDYSHHIEEQLTKAKEIIRDLIFDLVAIDGEQAEGLDSVKKAKQFFREMKEDVFDDVSKNMIIYVPAESVEKYKTARGWSRYADKIKAIER